MLQVPAVTHKLARALALRAPRAPVAKGRAPVANGANGEPNKSSDVITFVDSVHDSGGGVWTSACCATTATLRMQVKRCFWGKLPTAMMESRF